VQLVSVGYPEDPIAFPQLWSFRAFLQDRELLPQGEVLGGQPGAIAKEGSDESNDSTQHGHFTPSQTTKTGAESVARPSIGSSHKSFVGKNYGIFGMHKYRRLVETRPPS